MRAPLNATRDLARICSRCQREARISWVSSPQAYSSTPPTTTSSRSKSTTASFSVAGQKRWLSQSPPLPKPASTTSASTNANIRSAATPPTTHYEFFPISLPDGPPPNGHFPIDVRALRREFLQLQAKAHPDMHPAEHKTRAEATSARINEAFRTLCNPLLRAQYLLSLRGVDVANDETLKIEDPELLMIVLEAREEIEEAQEESELESLRGQNDIRIRDSEEVLEGAFRNDDIETAKREAVKLRYWVNVKESLDNWERGKPIVLEH